MTWYPATSSGLGDHEKDVVYFDTKPIIGWRAWQIEFIDGEPQSVRSITYPLRWPPRKIMRAHCIFAYQKTQREAFAARPHHSPTVSHSCGIYSVKTSAQARTWTTAAGQQRIIGKVALWGRVLMYSEGAKAEFAYPVNFIVPPTLKENMVGIDHADLCAWLENAYGVEAHVGEEEFIL